MLKNFLLILFVTPLVSHAADAKKQSYISELEKQWLILVKENNYTSDVAQDAISLKNQIKEAMQQSGLNWAEINEIELTALKNATEKNKVITKAKL